MKRTGFTSAPCLLLGVLLALSTRPTLADPLHKFGTAGAWVHVDSGWQFPQAIGDFAREAQPYNIDGNNDAGVEYRQASGLLAEVQVYAADSAATDATLAGAKATAAGKAGEAASLESEQPFQLDGVTGASGVKITYAPKQAAGVRTHLYYFTTDHWRVKVLASTRGGGKDADLELDAFVQALPWSTLGTNPGLH